MNKNKFIKNKSYCEFHIFDKNKNIKAKVKIDKDDIAKVSKINWTLSGNGYVYNRNKKLYLHRYLINNNSKTQKIVTDHINRNILDNRKKNLRIVSQKINKYNTKDVGLLSIFYRKRTNAWEAYIGKRYLGQFKDKKDAISRRLKELNKIIGDKRGSVFPYLFWIFIGFIGGIAFVYFLQLCRYI